jgi:hypothetical protein
MPSTYSPDLRIELIANGEKSGTWGTITNDNLGVIIEDAISGLASVTTASANQALTAQNGAVDQARCAAVSLDTSTGANFAVYVPPVTKLYAVINSSAYTATVYCSTVIGNTTAAGAGVAIPTGKSVLLRSDGTNIVEQLNHVVGNLSTGGNLSVTGTAAVTGVLTAPTAAPGTNTTQAATTAFVQAALSSLLPTGVITMWSGAIATVPAGWYLCDGTNGTPDLRNKFIIAANADDAGVAKTSITGTPTQTGGSKDAIVVSHTHTTDSAGAATGSISANIGSDFGSYQTGSASGVFSVSGGSLPNRMQGAGGTGSRPTVDMSIPAHTHTINSTGSSGTNANLPPYYALAYIMKA